MRGHLQTRGLARAGQRALCGDGARKEARENCLHRRKAGERKAMTDAKGTTVKA